MLYVHTFVNNFFVNYVLIAERLCSVSVAITGLGPDFTSLKSFGSVDAFAESLVKKKTIIPLIVLSKPKPKFQDFTVFLSCRIR